MKIQLILSILLLGFVLPSTVHAHRIEGNEIDTCRIPVGTEVVHFSAYTGQTGGRGLCQIIPVAGLTDLVFDYEGQKLRETTVEFEVTKEPEGDRVYYHKPAKIKKGTVDAKVDFSKFGAGNYLAHVTIMYEGEKQDSHLPFTVGLESEEGGPPTSVIILLSILAIAVFGMMVMSSMAKRKPPASTDE